MITDSAARHRHLLWVAVGIAVVGAGMFSGPWRWLESAEQHALDFAFQLRGPESREPRSVIVGVADSTLSLAERAPELARREPLAAMTPAWPWNRRVFAAVVRTLRASGARVIVFDILFDTENPGDAEFARALAEPGPPVVLASLMQTDVTGLGEITARLQEPQKLLRVAVGGRMGYADVFPDADGVLRMMTVRKFATEFAGQPPIAEETPLFSLAGAAWEAARLRPESPSLPPAGLINYLGPAGTLATVPMEDLFDPGRWNSAFLRGGGIFRDRVVWVGGVAESVFKDDRVTPFGRMAGVEAQAQAFESLAGPGMLRTGSPLAAVACVWGVAAAAALVVVRTGRLSRLLLVIVAGAAGWAAFGYWLFSRHGVVLPMVAPLAAWLAAGAGGAGVRFVVEQRERHRLRRVLGQYVSEEVARVIVDQPDEFSQSLRGGRRPVTVLFADLRGFTTWVETAEPESFVAQLNEYFGAVVDCVLAEGGTLQKFIGDAVLAVWGDTRSAGAAADATRAVAAARAMQAAVARLNAGWAGRRDRSAMTIGIGLHHGVAMVGNVGHAQRMEFTVLGDVVNVAARLESANRQLGTTVLVSGAIRDLVGDAQRFAPLGRYGLKGRREGVALYVPLGPSTESAPDWLEAAQEVLASWTAGDFPTAARSYADLAGRSAPLAEFFAAQAGRARQLGAEPPADWRGEYRFEEK